MNSPDSKLSDQQKIFAFISQTEQCVYVLCILQKYCALLKYCACADCIVCYTVEVLIATPTLYNVGRVQYFELHSCECRVAAATLSMP